MYIMRYNIYKPARLPLCNTVSIHPMFMGCPSLSLSLSSSLRATKDRDNLGKNLITETKGTFEHMLEGQEQE